MKRFIVLLFCLLLGAMFAGCLMMEPADDEDDDPIIPGDDVVFFDDFTDISTSENYWEVGCCTVDYFFTGSTLMVEQDPGTSYGWLVITEDATNEWDEDFDWQDYEVELMIRGDSCETGFVLRYDGDVNSGYIQIIVKDGGIYPWILENGSWIELPESVGHGQDFNDGNYHKLNARISTDFDGKANITIMYNDVEYYTWTDDVPDRISAGYPGIYVQPHNERGAYFEIDYFQVTPL